MDCTTVPRVLMLSSPTTAAGPLPKIVPEILSALRDRGFVVEWLAWGGAGAGETRAAKALARVGDALAARRFLSRHPATSLVVHTSHDWRTVPRDLLLLALCRSRAQCAVLVLHGSAPGRVSAHPRSLFSKLTRVVLSMADAVAVLSTEECSAWSELLPLSHIVVVRNPVPGPPTPSVKKQTHSAKPRVLYVGRLVPAKGCADLVGGFGLLRRSVDCELRIVGDGPERPSLERTVHDMGLDECVRMTGNLAGEELEDEYAAATVLVLPSYDEGLPTVVLEAMVRSVPVVTTRLRGTADYFTDSHDLLFVPPHDPEALSAALERLLGDAALRRRLVESARKTVAQFDRSSVVSDYESLFRSAVRVAESRRKKP
jgi:glycosyltransferase involved in cell wall biosynthesis